MTQIQDLFVFLCVNWLKHWCKYWMMDADVRKTFTEIIYFSERRVLRGDLFTVLSLFYH